MPRQILITRTIKTKTASVMCINNETNAVETKEIIIPRMIDNDKKILAYAVGELGEMYTPAKVVKVEEAEALYGMTEEDFVKNAKILPPRKCYESN